MMPSSTWDLRKLLYDLNDEYTFILLHEHVKKEDDKFKSGTLVFYLNASQNSLKITKANKK
jgi:hypothetical protein